MRSRNLVGATISKNLKPAGDGKWAGSVYSPKKGKTYSGFATVKGNINAKVTPSENSPGILDLLEGEMVVVLDSKKPWYNIEDFNGRKAWVHEDQIFLSKED